MILMFDVGVLAINQGHVEQKLDLVACMWQGRSLGSPSSDAYRQ